MLERSAEARRGHVSCPQYSTPFSRVSNRATSRRPSGDSADSLTPACIRDTSGHQRPVSWQSIFKAPYAEKFAIVIVDVAHTREWRLGILNLDDALVRQIVEHHTGAHWLQARLQCHRV